MDNYQMMMRILFQNQWLIWKNVEN